MVQIKSAAVVLILVAPSLSLPVQNLSERSSDDLEVREASPEPKFKLSATQRRQIAHLPSSVQYLRPQYLRRKAASLTNFFTREDGIPQIEAREIGDIIEAIQDISERELDAMEELAARYPKWSGLNKLRSISKTDASDIVRREEDGEVVLREDLLDILDLSERDFEEMEEITARDPKFRINFKRIVGKVKHVVNKVRHVVNKVKKVARVALKAVSFVYPAAGVASKFIREEGADIGDLMARDYNDFDQLD